MADILFLCGCASVVTGVAMVSIPAALVVGGCMAIVTATLITKSRSVRGLIDKVKL